MKKVLGIVILAAALCGSALAQQFTSGQIFPTNTATQVPAANATQIVATPVQWNALTYRVGTQNFGATNAVTFYAYLRVGGSTNLIPLTIAGTYTTNLTFNPSNTNITESVTLLATNLNVNIVWVVATTNDANTNLQATIGR